MYIVTDHAITDYTYYGLKIIKYEKKDDIGFFSSNLFKFYSIINEDTIVFGFQFSENTYEKRTLKITVEKFPLGIANDFYFNLY